ncbi:MAG: hypothetical protein QMC98_02405 [Candidatus Thermoplasmatota archaeon]|nr:hypothetical protein [Candidatus Thermoplasmatota archaeon]
MADCRPLKKRERIRDCFAISVKYEDWNAITKTNCVAINDI